MGGGSRVRMLNIVVPIAGEGSRFSRAGYSEPKPLVSVHGVPMIEVVVRNIRPERPHRFIFLAREKHLRETRLPEVLVRVAPGGTIVPVRAMTEGAACTVLLSRDLIDSDDPLMLANGDQYVELDINRYLEATDHLDRDGVIMTFRSKDPKWSYVRVDHAGWVREVVEKEVVSEHATVGIYNFRRGRDFVSAAVEMIRRDLRVNNEFYVAPTYNQLIERGATVGTYDVGAEGRGMHGLGTPEDLGRFLARDVSLKALRGVV